jgi:pimeloyl-ACP methyl ester carboxylesterase
MKRRPSLRYYSHSAFRIALTLLFLSSFLQIRGGSCNAAEAQGEDAGNAQETVREIALADGGTQRVLYARPASPKGTIIMLPGGAGDLGVEDDGGISHGNNFVVRTRALWLDRGYALVIPDALNGQNMRGLRSSPEYAQAVASLVSFAHAQAPGPVFLLGTSQGSIAAMNGAAHLSDSTLSGVVLTESVTRESKSGETVFDASPEHVTVPALIVANRDSACRVAPAEDAPRIAAAMPRAPEVKILYVQGGVTRSRACGSLSPHGYLGIERAVVERIVAWLKTHKGT